MKFQGISSNTTYLIQLISATQKNPAAKSYCSTSTFLFLFRFSNSYPNSIGSEIFEFIQNPNSNQQNARYSPFEGST